MTKKLVIGTRASKLALWQAEHIAGQIRQKYPAVAVSLKQILTTGDKILDVPLAQIGGKGLFTHELEKELLAGTIDLAVHSLKDMPTQMPPGLMLGVVTRREDPGDALVSNRYKSLEALPQGARVGTSSLRRRAQLLYARPDLDIRDLRGNLDTRLAKLDSQNLDAIVLAVAGLKRLGWEQRISQILPYSLCLPAVGQGALALEIRQEDQGVVPLLEFLDHEETRAAVTAERAYLHQLAGDCQVPFGVYGQIEDNRLLLEAVILSTDGRRRLTGKISGSTQEAEILGRKLAIQMYDAGGKELLAELHGRCSREEES